MSFCWIYKDQVTFVRPLEVTDISEMGPVYELTSEDSDHLAEAEQLMKMAQYTYWQMSRRIANKLRNQYKEMDGSE